VEYLCSRVALISEGVVMAEGSPDELRDSYGAKNLEEVFMEVTHSE
jgi:ABC-2 type transport system ATP-binding protein